MAGMMDRANIKLQHYGDAMNVTWYWTDETGKTISPYIGDSDVAERWGKLYLQAVKDGMVVIKGQVYHANK
jgi:hypothetical protein